jgi:TRAP-type C4-dicarboxylate transport system substrate-binding protein
VSWRGRLILIAVMALAFPRVPLRAQSAAIKLATVVPDGSIWDKSLEQMGTEWKAATGDRVTLTVFSGGSQGDEATVLRKMRLSALQGASLTVVGLASIDPAFNVFNIPFFFQSYDELNAVVEKLTPLLKQRIEAKGFVLLNWGHGGWLQVFSKQPVQSVADLKRARLYTSAGDDRMTQWYKANGFQPRAMAMTDVLTGLTTGMIDALPTTPLAAMSFQWYKQTSYMLDLGISPIVGATVISKRTWDRISPADRAKMGESARRVEKQLQTEVPKQDGLATLLMQNQGLKITKASGPEWQQLGDSLARTMRGVMVPADVFDLALKERDAFRQRKTAESKTPAAPAQTRPATPPRNPARQ